jgi:ubiquinone/menaquinone biosynthesis C-methylase UbiE
MHGPRERRSVIPEGCQRGREEPLRRRNSSPSGGQSTVLSPGRSDMHDPNDRKVRQRRLDQKFDSQAHEWKDIYESEDSRSIVLRGRCERALRLTRQLPLGEGSRALDVGCGAGVMATELACQGLRVAAVDTVPRMLQLTQERAIHLGLDKSISVTLCDARGLPFATQTFDLVVALGLISWLDSPLSVLTEMARVCRPGGYAVITCGNLFRFESLVDPRHTALLEPLRHRVKERLRAKDLDAGRGKPRYSSPRQRWYAPRTFDSMLSSAGLGKVAACTYGFRAPRFFGRRLFPDRFATRFHYRLQALADAQLPLVRAGGFSYVVLAQKVLDDSYKPLREDILERESASATVDASAA